MAGHVLTTQARVDETLLKRRQSDKVGELLELIKQEERRMSGELIEQARDALPH